MTAILSDTKYGVPKWIGVVPTIIRRQRLAEAALGIEEGPKTSVGTERPYVNNQIGRKQSGLAVSSEELRRDLDKARPSDEAPR